MPQIFCFALVLVLTTGSITGQEDTAPQSQSNNQSAPIEITNYREAWKHRLTPRTSIRTPQAKDKPLLHSEELRIVVDLDGNVISVKPERTTDDFTEEALSQARSWKYRPFEKNGKQVSATFIDYVMILPPLDVPKVHAPFPRIRDWSSLRIRLERTACYGTCPSYTVEVDGDGSVLYDGKSHVVVTGAHRAHVSKDDVEQLVQAFQKADYFSLRDSYVYGVTDNPTYTTSISFDGHTKSVKDYVGLRAGMPEDVTNIEDLIDRLSGTERWITGNATTITSLAEEGWDFKSSDAGQVFSRAVQKGNVELVHALLSAGVPIDEESEGGATALASAAQRKDKETVFLLLAAGAGVRNPAKLDKALSSAARAGDLEIVRALLKHGANPEGRDDRETVLMSAASSGEPEVVGEILKSHPDVNAKDNAGQTALFAASTRWASKEGADGATAEVVRMLIKAGGDPNLHDKLGDTPLHGAHRPEIAKVLISSGADVNARNLAGETPLMKTTSPEIARMLIESGADISARDERGRTALEHAKNTFREVATVLESAQAASQRK